MVARWTRLIPHSIGSTVGCDPNVINNDLGPYLGWKTKRQLIDLVKQGKEAKDIGRDLSQLGNNYPEVLKQIAQAINPVKIGKENIENVLQIMKQLMDASLALDRGFKEAFLSVVRELPKQKKRALEDLETLLGDWSLQQITSVSRQVQQRLDNIELFKQRITDDRTYEIRGPNSIHRILERSMWLIDERYWLLQENETLRHFIGEEMAKRDRKRYGSLRPDFVCGMVGEKLVIIELKRPKHTLTADNLNQLETYVAIAEDYKKFRSTEAYLIGNRIDEDLKKRMKYRASSFGVGRTLILSMQQSRDIEVT